MRLAKMVVGLLALAVVCLAAAYAAAAPAGARKIVVFSEETTEEQRLTLAAAAGKVVRSLELIQAVVIEVPASEMKSAEIRLLSEPGVMAIEDDTRFNWLVGVSAPARVTDVPLPAVSDVVARARGASAAGQQTPWGVKRVKAEHFWRASRGGEGIRIAVIDTGIEMSHPDLAPNIKGGWNTIGNHADFNDDNGHGTHVAGTIAAVDNRQGVVGVAPNASLYGVKVLDAYGSGTFSDVIAGMEWAIRQRVDIMSMSLGASRGNEALRRAVAAARRAGIVLIAAAGNSGADVGYPAAYPGAIAIAAMDSENNVASFSSRGQTVAFIAPGVDVNSTYKGRGYDVLSGTSMATPHVAGLAALLLSAQNMTMEDFLWKLRRSSSKLRNVPAEQQGAGVIDASRFSWR